MAEHEDTAVRIIDTSSNFDELPHDVIASECDPYVAGFRDCRCQVISYLQRKKRSGSHLDDDDDVTNDVVLDDELVEDMSQHLLAVENRLQLSPTTTTGPSPWKRHLIARTDASFAISLPEVAPTLNDSALGNSFEVSAAEELSSVVDVQPEPEVPSSVSENANILMRLARENPQVGRLLDELFDLMDSEDDDVTDDVSESDAESDEGVHEMNGELYNNSLTSVDDACTT